MTQLSIPFEGSTLDFEIPSPNLSGVFSPCSIPPLADLDGAIREALDRPLGQQPLESWARPSDRVLIISDDNTRFTPASRMILQILERPVPEGILTDISGLALNTASRGPGSREAERMVTRAAEFLSPLSVRLIFKKIDSQLRGMPGLEIETLRKGLDLACAFIAPAYPEQGRITRDAVHWVHGIPVAESEAGRDPVTPVTRSSLPDLIADQAGVRTSHVYLKGLNQGMEEVCRKIVVLMREGAQAITFDSVYREHLDMVARLAALVAGLLEHKATDGIFLSGGDTADLEEICAMCRPLVVGDAAIIRNATKFRGLNQGLNTVDGCFSATC